ncbi:carbon-phosphorus lyase complex subunit [uncultured delta proteobacterium]|uniref:Carbon-phosphorus lyase complex subunit n=1 Tax=uncultured delta proteobacterium TaxID=34034 RepID=A0A212K6J9_9DELT|nr:carbon-phosphorus lyase complex subunit [uncultured delta proteobacterium]
MSQNTADTPHVAVRNLSKTFVLHAQGGAVIDAFHGLNLDAWAGECLALHGPSGSGKSTLLRSLYANYKPTAGSIVVRHGRTRVDMVTAEPRTVLEVRRETMGYVSQFLRVIPRVSTIDIVAERLTEQGIDAEEARERAGELLNRLRIPKRLWNLAPATFSGGEQQRVNIARGFIREYPILLLDEPTASLDGKNRQTVVELIGEAKARGAAVIGIFHDDEVRETVAERTFAFGKQREKEAAHA